MSHLVITGGHSTAWHQIRRVENVSKNTLSVSYKTFACERLRELILNVALMNFFKLKLLVHFRLVYGKVYFHPPGQFLALNGRMGYKIRQGNIPIFKAKNSLKEGTNQ